MNPSDFSWTEDQQVTVTNPTAEDYKFKVHNKDYELQAGRTAKMPGYMAWLYVYGQSVKQAQRDGVFNRWNEEGFRQEYYEKFVSGVDSIVQTVAVEPEPMSLVEEAIEPEEPTKQDDIAVNADTSEEEADEKVNYAKSTSKPKIKAMQRGRSTRI